MTNYISIIWLFLLTLLMIFSFKFIFKSYIIRDDFIIERSFYIIIINILINIIYIVIINNISTFYYQFLDNMWIYKLFYISIIILNFIFIYFIFWRKIINTSFWYNNLKNFSMANNYTYLFLLFLIFFIGSIFFKSEINIYLNILKDIIINNDFIQFLLFFLLIELMNKLIWFLNFSRCSRIYFIPLHIIKIIFIILTIFLFFFIWDEIIKGNIYLEYFYRFFTFILINIFIQWFFIWNISDEFDWMPEDRTKLFKFFFYIIMVIILSTVYICKKLIKLSILLSFIGFIIYIILKYDLEAKIYYLIYIPYIEYYKYIYVKLINIYLFTFISLVISKIIYDQMYGKIFISQSRSKLILKRDKNGYIFFFVLYLVMISLFLISYFFYDVIINNINLHNLGLCLDMFSYIITFIYNLIIDILINIWTIFWKIVRLIIDFTNIIIELLKDN